MKRGLIQVYTGEGKGKTTAALGLAMRAIGHGLNVCIVQFMKPSDFVTGELLSAERLSPQLKILHCGDSTVWGKGKPKSCLTQDMEKATKETLALANFAAKKGHYDIMVLDEINVALEQRLLDLQEVLAFINDKPDNLELVFTGRGAPIEIIEIADLVTEMIQLKHPFEKGIKARKGIEY